MTAQDSVPARRRTAIAIVAAASMFGITYGLSSPLIALELQRRGHGEVLIGLNAAMHALGVLTVAWMLPRAASRWGMRRILIVALMLVGVVLMLFPASAWVWLWFPFRYVLGIGSEGVLVTTESWTSHLSDEASRTTNMAIYTAAVSVGLAIGPLLLGHVGSGDAVPFLIGAALAMAACAFVVFDRAPSPQFAHRPLSGGVVGLLRHAPVAMAATALNAALETSGLTFLPMYAMRLGWSEQGATALVATLLVGAIVLQVPIGWLGDRFDRRRLVLAFSALSALGALLWPFAIGVAWLGHALLFVWGGVFVGIYTLVVTIVGSRYSEGQLVQVYAGMSVAFGIGALLGPLLAGAAMHLSRDGLAWFAAAACAAFGLFAWRSRAPA
ncbi:MFS transporter [Lysobacter sp. FW306-1B-D06B]|uniref:MFS transporter n=1 Tax=Lysobacter sp. FW306-1B-D06B TaxID=3140250 RepID=UPI0031405CE8